MSDLSGRLAPVIHKALLAEGVQLTGKELTPVSVAVAAYVKANFEAVSKELQAEIAADKTAAEATTAPVASGPLQAPPPPGGAK
jgi:hypothetical protein